MTAFCLQWRLAAQQKDVETITIASLCCFTVVEHATRGVRIQSVTANLTTDRATQQAGNLIMGLGWTGSFKFAIRDRDSQVTALFDEVLAMTARSGTVCRSLVLGHDGGVRGC
ncbi:hypothetical protein ABGB17_17505 [Sphaerisporangium sp. B11E5]|uniref:hypothetical protein n=1 Tax=Sphaerisporangium sp. B11E5 TaxID=3153563 RepID=UPI00325F1582